MAIFECTKFAGGVGGSPSVFLDSTLKSKYYDTNSTHIFVCLLVL